jgi:hypothetical protein
MPFALGELRARGRPCVLFGRQLVEVDGQPPETLAQLGPCLTDLVD